MVEDGHQTHAALPAAAAKQLTVQAAGDKLAQVAPNSSEVGAAQLAQQTVIVAAVNSSLAEQLPPSFIRSNVANLTSANHSTTGAADLLQPDGQPHREPLTTIFPASKESVKTPLISQEKFHWDQVRGSLNVLDDDDDDDDNDKSGKWKAAQSGQSN